MAFLDNSGDIILDAVLTDTGRKRLANGNFSIIQFGLGDDEINYGTYDLANPSGSAYYDLEIMQTPVFEATTATNAAINYGLMNLSRTDLLYLPSLKFNTKLDPSSTDAKTATRKTNNMFYLAVNQETSTKLTNDSTDDLGFRWIVNRTPGNVIFFESGLDTSDLAATNANRTGYIIGTGLLDSTLTVGCDSKLINQVGSLKSSTTFANSITDNTSLISFAGMVHTTPRSTSLELGGYNDYSINGIADAIFEPDTGDDNNYSVFLGPRGICQGVTFSVVAELSTLSGGSRSRLYSDYGVVGSTTAGPDLGKTYDYIDTTVFVQGDFSGASLQIPLRIIRYVSG
jgi:hypothetical protein